MENKIFIVILNYNCKLDIIDCLKPLIQSLPVSRQSSIIIVDNASIDGSVQLIKQKFPRLKIIENKKNLGFAAGNNIGIKYALKNGAEYVLLLNPDTIVKKGFLKPLLKNPADIVAPVIKFKREKEWIYDFGGKINWCLGRSYHLETKSQKLNLAIDYVSGCAMLIRKQVFEKIGFLDERFFLYFEDADFCLRARKAGFKIAVEPKSIISHKLREGKRKSWLQIYHLLRSNLIFINRHISFWRKPLAYLYWWTLLSKLLLARII